ncbi:MAG: hypothetical protein K6E35_07835 [Bacteroidales bacterium]|nr:hypothetical protein [Bacteroidales bacterium]
MVEIISKVMGALIAVVIVLALAAIVLLVAMATQFVHDWRKGKNIR